MHFLKIQIMLIYVLLLKSTSDPKQSLNNLSARNPTSTGCMISSSDSYSLIYRLYTEGLWIVVFARLEQAYLPVLECAHKVHLVKLRRRRISDFGIPQTQCSAPAGQCLNNTSQSHPLALLASDMKSRLLRWTEYSPW